MKALDPGACERLQRELAGTVIGPEDADYDDARRVFNGMIDRRPAVIVRCAGEADAGVAIAFAREHGLAVAVRGGGHNVAGNAVCEGGLVIDLSLMRAVDVDPVRRRARVQGGATWGDFDAAAQAHGLATPGGIVSTTGVAGLTLGGGIGVLRGVHGLTCDNLVAAELVTAGGEHVVAGGELLWGLRGGGGNFGVVTTFEFALHPLDGVVSGPLDYAYSTDFLRFYEDFTASAPDELTCDLVLRRTPDGGKLATLLTSYCGPADNAPAALEPLRRRFTPVRDAVAPRPYVESQRLYDSLSPWGWRNYWKTNGLGALTADSIRAIDEIFKSAPSGLSQVLLEHLHGEMHRTAPGTNALPFARAKFDLLINAKWLEPAGDDANIAWARQGFELMRPFLSSGAYPNYLFQESRERVREAFGADAYARLVALKDRYDPTNFFRLNQNIQPSALTSV